MILDLVNFEDHCQVENHNWFSEMYRKGRHSSPTQLTAPKIPPENGKNTAANNNSAAKNSSTPTAIDVLWGRKI